MTAALGLFLPGAMREAAFKPVSREERKGLGGLFSTVRDARARPAALS